MNTNHTSLKCIIVTTYKELRIFEKQYKFEIIKKKSDKKDFHSFAVEELYNTTKRIVPTHNFRASSITQSMISLYQYLYYDLNKDTQKIRAKKRDYIRNRNKRIDNHIDKLLEDLDVSYAKEAIKMLQDIKQNKDIYAKEKNEVKYTIDKKYLIKNMMPITKGGRLLNIEKRNFSMEVTVNKILEEFEQYI